MNLKDIGGVILFGSISIHILVCTYIATTSSRTGEYFDTVRPEITTAWEILCRCLIFYSEAFYLIVMTITTVGYGVPFADGFNDYEKQYIMLVMFFGLAIFSAVKDQVFNYRVTLTVEMMLQDETENLEALLYKVSRIFQNKERFKPISY